MRHHEMHPQMLKCVTSVRWSPYCCSIGIILHLSTHRKYKSFYFVWMTSLNVQMPSEMPPMPLGKLCWLGITEEYMYMPELKFIPLFRLWIMLKSSNCPADLNIERRRLEKSFRTVELYNKLSLSSFRVVPYHKIMRRFQLHFVVVLTFYTSKIPAEVGFRDAICPGVVAPCGSQHFGYFCNWMSRFRDIGLDRKFWNKSQWSLMLL